MSLETDFPSRESISVIEKKRRENPGQTGAPAKVPLCHAAFFHSTSLITQHANIIHPKMPFQTLLSGLCARAKAEGFMCVLSCAEYMDAQRKELSPMAKFAD